MDNGTEAYLGKPGHWQPAFRPDDHQLSVTLSPVFEQSNPPDSPPSQEELSDPAHPALPMISRAQGPLPVDESARPAHHYDDRAQHATGQPRMGTDTSQREASRVPDTDAYTEGEARVEQVYKPSEDTSERSGLHGMDDTVATNSKYPQNAASKSQEQSARFGLSLPIRRREEEEDDDNGSEMSSDGDEERLDPAWGIKRMDPSQVLAQVQRSPSFPDFVSQREKPTVKLPAHLPMTQAERTLQEVEEINGGYSPFTQESNAHWQSARLIHSGTEHEQALDDAPPETNHTLTVGETINGESKAETRFEEGVPLIHEEPDVQARGYSPTTRPAVDSLFDVSEETDEASFFDKHAQDDTETHHPPSLDRKATADVLQSLHFSTRDAADSPVDELSQKFPESTQDNNWFTSDDTFESANRDNKVDDISEMWKAALDDDEFLVEDPDELLPDSTPDSPSSFLESLKDDEANPQKPEDSRLSFNNQSSRGSASLATNQPSNHTAYQSSNASYAPHQPSTSDLTQISPSTFGNIGFSRPGISSMKSMQQQLQRPAPAPKTESFVDQSKGGYKSPYDLPLEISKPRKRPQMQAPAPPSPALPPPPRTSSMTSEKPSVHGPAELQSPFSPTNSSFPSHVRSSSSQGAPGPASKPPPRAATQAPGVRPPSTSFFEELPITSRPRPPTGQGRYTPQQNGPMAPPQLLPQSPPSITHPPPQRPSPPSHPPADPYAQYQLQRPERLDPYANVPLQPPPAPVNVANRYSPAPAASQLGARPVPSPRYSPAPPSQQSNAPPANRYASQPAQIAQPPQSKPSPPNRYVSQPNSTASTTTAAHAFQPRTSSPLAHFGRSIGPQATEAFPPSMGNEDASALMPMHNHERYQSEIMSKTPASQFRPAAAAPPPGQAIVLDAGFQPPRRSQTQSPGKRGPVPRLAMTSQDNMQRPASVHGQTSPVKALNPYEFVPPSRTSVRQRGLSQNLNFIPPIGEERNDELQRWKGSPVFRFGFGGSAVSSFPKHVPRYGAGSAMPMIKPSAGEIHINSAKEILPLPDQIAKFPGPLRSKSKKKDVLTWLSAKIAAFEQDEIHFTSQTQLPDPRKRTDEKVLLWKIVKAMVEHDGTLEGAAGVQMEINLILSPEVHVLDDASATQYTAGNDLTGIYRPAGSAARSEPIDPVAVDTLRKSLLRGEREKAMWHAVDNRLWAHALLIGSTLDKSKWREVVQEFVRREVKIIGANTESLAALYEVFAGNLEESIDELVPPSARAGLQMVSKVDSTGPTKNALDGLDRWRETLSLILNNRSAEDHQALAALGGLLASYGRVEAAHICYLFSRAPGRAPIFAGADDPSATIVLLGADHRTYATNFSQDEDAMLLTEVYEFATSVLSTSSQSASMPHFQAYKLQRALVLAETGYKTESQAYCDAISAISKSTTKASPYYGPQFFEVLDELSRRLKQTPTDSSSWIAKPSIEKVSGSVWNKFHSFVAGDESDAESRGSGKDANFEAGPFANVTGTPSLSRSGSTTDLYGSSLASAPQSIPNTIAGSRYAPTSQFARTSPELLRARGSLDSQRSPPFSNPMQPHTLNDQASSFGSQSYMPMAGSVYQPLGQSPPSNRYQSTPPQTSYMQNSSLESSPQRSYRPQQPDSYVPTPPPEESVPSYMPASIQNPQQGEDQTPTNLVPAFGGYTPSPQAEFQQPPAPSIEDDQTTQLSTQPYGYDPPSDTGYVPYEPDPDSDSEKRRDPPRKKSFMDDDNDDFPRDPPATASTSSVPNPTDDAASRRRANDLATEAAFLAAAAEDAKRDKEKDSKTDKSKASGWFSGWLPGKKGDSLDAGSSGTKEGERKAIKAKLGEESSFYYDKELKRWVNKKDPNSVQAGPKAAPPPPKGPMGALRGLTPSTSLPNLNGPPGRTRTPDEAGSMALPALNGPSRTDSMGPLASGRAPSGAGTPPNALASLGLVPPPRPSTATSTASSIDDLLGPPNAGGRKSVRGAKGKGKGRYIDLVAAKQADS
jgi:hypothetical protein